MVGSAGRLSLVRREAAVGAGLFDERHLYEEDVSRFLRSAIRRHGGRILFTPAAEISHLRGRSRRLDGPRADADTTAAILRSTAPRAALGVAPEMVDADTGTDVGF